MNKHNHNYRYYDFGERMGKRVGEYRGDFTHGVIDRVKIIIDTIHRVQQENIKEMGFWKRLFYKRITYQDMMNVALKEEIIKLNSEKMDKK